MHEIPFKNKFDPNIWSNVPKMCGNKEARKKTAMNSVENELFFFHQALKTLTDMQILIE